MLKICVIISAFFVFRSNALPQDINYKSQSLYLYVFSKNITWPKPKTNGEKFFIGVYGNSPIYKELQVMSALKKTADGKKIVIKKIESFDELKQLHILYIASSKSRELRHVLESIQSNPVLVVAERDGLARKGASINFLITENDYLKFEVNTKAIRKHNLKISEALLKKGYVVK